ncbi:MAG: tRNA pseudouridine(13) synthase TruD, partial [Candidatus Altiarchaeota archaeon]|nr:tRNA pseudouridine(13) synthase TruD [Candidatus Altiarchaeota archaeon]
MLHRIKPPSHDVYVGLECYKSTEYCIGGMLKQTPEDFIVQEITEEKKVLEFEKDTPGDMLPGDYTHATLVKREWDTMRAVSEIAKRVGVSRNRFAFAGTKDKHALTAQRISAYRVPVEKLKAVNIKDITIKDVGYADENLGLGSLWGNKFTIRIHNVCEKASERIDTISEELSGGFPNFYGRQRFGEARPITHEVGKHILMGDFESAIMCYLTKTFGSEATEVEKIRKDILGGRDYKEVLNELPKSLGYERSILNHLIEKPGDYRGCFDHMPKNLAKMFVHAYQSYIFNKALSRYINEGASVEKLPL